MVDNQSTEPGFEDVQKKFSQYKNIIWIKNPRNTGGLVDGLTLPYCRGRYLLILGPDVIVLPNAIKNMIDFMDAHKDAGAVTAKILNPDRSPQIYIYRFWNLPMVFFSSYIGHTIDKMIFKSYFRKSYFGDFLKNVSEPTVVEQPSGACLMLRWDPPVVAYVTDREFPFYFGDVDLCKRIYLNGYKIYLLPSAEVIHRQSSAFKKADPNWKAIEYTKSLIKYFRKYHENQVWMLKLILLANYALRSIFNLGLHILWSLLRNRDRKNFRKNNLITILKLSRGIVSW